MVTVRNSMEARAAAMVARRQAKATVTLVLHEDIAAERAAAAAAAAAAKGVAAGERGVAAASRAAAAVTQAARKTRLHTTRPTMR